LETQLATARTTATTLLAAAVAELSRTRSCPTADLIPHAS